MGAGQIVVGADGSPGGWRVFWRAPGQAAATGAAAQVALAWWADEAGTSLDPPGRREPTQQTLDLMGSRRHHRVHHDLPGAVGDGRTAKVPCPVAVIPAPRPPAEPIPATRETAKR